MSEIYKKWRNITSVEAKCVGNHALHQASELGIPVSIVVVDRAGVILLVEMDDDASPGTPEESTVEAKRASRYACALHGVVPMGVSGGPGEQDISIALAAAESIK
ncbi:heme-binding protein [Granulicella arctica]|uniref:Uncharacterized protein GlcG (DUF336 family) n=1 Tax=Granulicella arctica TaxID=940613 RepID=A0A7Y9PEW8_9BACT|nr:heme-binding protein [Granulicella arctica]NYF77913.1 uncharacterized protein GlcG (DUF336 family) [Granulicella arctica]